MATTLVQTRFTATTNASSLALAYNSNVTAGNMLYMLLAEYGTPTLDSIADTLLNSWTSVVVGTTPTYKVTLWKAPCGASGANTVTLTFSGSGSGTSGTMSIFEFAGQGTPTDGASNTLDVSVAVDPMPCATLSATGAGIAFCGVRIDNAFTLTSWGDSFVDAGSGARSRTAYRIITGATSLAPTMDNSTTETGESLTVVMYDQVVGGSGKPWLYYTQMSGVG